MGSRSNSNSIKNVAAIDEVTSDDLTFCSSNDERGLNNISKSNAGVILCDSTDWNKYISKSSAVIHPC